MTKVLFNLPDNNSRRAAVPVGMPPPPPLEMIESAESRDRWSDDPREGVVPNLNWIWSSTAAPPPITTHHAVTKRLHRLVRFSEEKLQQLHRVDGIDIDLAHPFGLKCVNTYCPTHRVAGDRVLSIGEIYRGWLRHSERDGNHRNTYTALCIYCDVPFIPRFAVRSVGGASNGSAANNATPSSPNRPKSPEPHVSKSPSDGKTTTTTSSLSSIVNEERQDGSASTTTGVAAMETNHSPPSAAPASATSSEIIFLSPWTLYKETLNILFEEGVLALLNGHFRHRSNQSAVVYWNLLITFRLRGLPMAFLFTKNIVESFPPAPPTTHPSSSYAHGSSSHHPSPSLFSPGGGGPSPGTA